MAKYLSYGSNCNPDVMQRKGVDYTRRVRASLSGYQLRFNMKALRERLPETIGFAKTKESPGGVVEGILYDLNPDHLPLLDESERYPEHYDRAEVTVDTESGAES